MDGDLSIIMERQTNETAVECNRFGECFEVDHVPFWYTKVGLLNRNEIVARIANIYNRRDK